ncbi:MAG: DUF3604 domain-containing protein [Halieaceae bacterium]|nr:DUF3604 domain-containing protein [Halieaceae bacterium]
MIKKISLAFILLLLIALGRIWYVGAAIGYVQPTVPFPADAPRPTEPATVPLPARQQAGTRILFGDLHVHTSYSMDAALLDTPAARGGPRTTPADACDFARYCSALDFWSINDHAEGLTPGQWQQTKEAVQQCDAVGDSDAPEPDMVSFLGWEWTQRSTSNVPSNHWGHKNVILRDIADDRVPARPIGSSRDSRYRQRGEANVLLRGLGVLAMSAFSGFKMDGYEDLAGHLQAINDTPHCGEGDARSLPDNCYESADTPTALFNKLDEWGYPALVIPHGLAWGSTNVAGADFNYQMEQHNPEYQRLLEVYSGHGNSEIFRDLDILEAGSKACPAPANNFTPCCWQAGEIIRGRCIANGGSDCESRAAETRQAFVDAAANGQFKNARTVVPDTHLNDWGQCDQLAGTFQPSWNYQARQSAQYMLTLGSAGQRMQVGFIGSSDTHTARPGSSYKEVARKYMTDTRDRGGTLGSSNPAADRPVKPRRLPFKDGEDAAQAFFYTSGLVAVHARNKSREAIWEALQNRAVYGTSGPRIRLWFDLIDSDGRSHTMGSALTTTDAPLFRVSAMGSFKQQPGCPDFAKAALGAERLQRLCRNECLHPGNETHSIERIEVVRVLPRLSPQEASADLIQDPWRVFPCPAGNNQCSAEFRDEEYAALKREAVYYVRAVQEATPAIQGDPLGCDTDRNGACVKTNYCLGDEAEGDCLSGAEQRAWSSPIFLSPSPEKQKGFGIRRGDTRTHHRAVAGEDQRETSGTKSRRHDGLVPHIYGAGGREDAD